MEKNMFCYQCQEAAKGTGCTVAGVCGKSDSTAGLQDTLVYVLKGIALYNQKADSEAAEQFIIEGLFMTVTNTNFSNTNFVQKVKAGLALRDQLRQEHPQAAFDHDAGVWTGATEAEFLAKGKTVGVLATADEDIRSLRELLTYGLKGIAAYVHHAEALGYRDRSINRFVQSALVATLAEKPLEELIGLVLECGRYGVEAMALLDKANTETYGHPEITTVKTGVGTNPGILISGHDLKDLEQLLEQTQGTGIDVYTHGEMLPAHYYPAFKKYKHFIGNYGNSWWLQDKEFAAFNGPIVMTTNCLTPPKSAYRNRLYTTGVVGFEGIRHIDPAAPGQSKDFSAVIEQAKSCPVPDALEDGQLVGGFAHNTVIGLADTILDAVGSGAISRFVVMAGCDGRMKSRDYYSQFAQELPQDTVILTAGCAKYRYNKLGLGAIGGIPRVLDAGQCNDSYSLALIALKLKEALGLADINELPIVYNIAWYEQKAVIVLLALLYLGVKNIHLGPTLPAFVSPGVVAVLQDQFGIAGIDTVPSDLTAFGLVSADSN